MGATIIYDSSDDFIDALSARPDRRMSEYLAESVRGYVAAARDTGGRFVEYVKDRFEELSSRRYRDRVEHNRRLLNATWETNEYRTITVPDRIITAPPIMRRWIMAHPTLRKSYLEDGCSGYDGDFYNPHKQGVGEKHYDYRRVMDGAITTTDGKASYANYRDSGVSLDDQLDAFQKAMVRISWLTIDRHLENSDIDPTSSLNERLT